MENLKCIIFDCDGVLVNTETIGNRVLIAMAKDFGLEMSLENAFRDFNGRSLKDCFAQIEKRIGRKLPENFEEEYRRQSFAAFKSELRPIEGVRAFIDSLKMPFCVASSGPVEKIILNLTTAGLIDRFENRIFSSYQIGSWKPDPGIFLFAAKAMGFDAAECVVIEDSCAGVMAAKAGRFKVYGFANAHNESDLKEAGAIVFYSFEELALLLRMDN